MKTIGDDCWNWNVWRQLFMWALHPCRKINIPLHLLLSTWFPVRRINIDALKNTRHLSVAIKCKSQKDSVRYALLSEIFLELEFWPVAKLKTTNNNLKEKKHLLFTFILHDSVSIWMLAKHLWLTNMKTKRKNFLFGFLRRVKFQLRSCLWFFQYWNRWKSKTRKKNKIGR